MLGISCLAEELLAFHGGLSSMALLGLLGAWSVSRSVGRIHF